MICDNKKGIALITTLLLSLIALALIATLMNLVLSGAKMSGEIKTYTSALEAAKGGVEVYMNNMRNFVYRKGRSSDTGVWCKVQQDTANWDVSCAGYMGAKGYTESQLSSHSSIDDIINYYDMRLDFGNYLVYGKMIDTRGASSNWFYTIETVSIPKNNTKQKAWYTVIVKTD